MERVLEIIRKDVAEDKVQIDTPTQNLESYFLEVVQKARRAATETSGARSGARVAAYLRGEAEEKPAGDRILERLSEAQPAHTAPAPVAAQPVAPVDQRKLEALAKPNEPGPTAAKVEEGAKAAELEKANEKLASLLGRPK
jgi:hypothetical protein